MTYQHFCRILYVIQINSVRLAEGLMQEVNKRELELLEATLETAIHWSPNILQ